MKDHLIIKMSLKFLIRLKYLCYDIVWAHLANKNAQLYASNKIPVITTLKTYMNKFQRPKTKFCHSQHYKCFNMVSSLKIEQEIQHRKNTSVKQGSDSPWYTDVRNIKK